MQHARDGILQTDISADNREHDKYHDLKRQLTNDCDRVGAEEVRNLLFRPLAGTAVQEVFVRRLLRSVLVLFERANLFI